GEELRETQDMLALCDADGYVLATAGHPGVIEETAEINLRVGGSWNEEAGGTNGIGSSLRQARADPVRTGGLLVPAPADAEIDLGGLLDDPWMTRSREHVAIGVAQGEH